MDKALIKLNNGKLIYNKLNKKLILLFSNAKEDQFYQYDFAAQNTTILNQERITTLATILRQLKTNHLVGDPIIRTTKFRSLCNAVQNLESGTALSLESVKGFYIKSNVVSTANKEIIVDNILVPLFAPFHIKSMDAVGKTCLHDIHLAFSY